MVTKPGFVTHLNELDYWTDCILVLDYDNLSIVEQIVMMMI